MCSASRDRRFRSLLVVSVWQQHRQRHADRNDDGAVIDIDDHASGSSGDRTAREHNDHHDAGFGPRARAGHRRAGRAGGRLRRDPGRLERSC
jgi:hypothetical protein